MQRCAGSGLKSGSEEGPSAPVEPPRGSPLPPGSWPRGAGGHRSRSPEEGPVGRQGGAPAAGTQVRTGLPAPQPPLLLSPLNPAARFRMVPTPAASTKASPQAPERRSDTDAGVLARNVEQRLPPARPSPCRESDRRHRGPRPEGDVGAARARRFT